MPRDDAGGERQRERRSTRGSGRRGRGRGRGERNGDDLQARPDDVHAEAAPVVSVPVASATAQPKLRRRVLVFGQHHTK